MRDNKARKEAIALGLTRYFTGKPCRHGHICERQTSNGVCLECSKQICRRYCERNPEKVRRWGKEYAAANPEWRKAHHRKYYQRHKVRLREGQKEYAIKNPDILAAGRRNYKTRKRNAVGSHTGKDIKAIYKSQRGKCAYCKIKVGKRYQVDHIMPLALGGENGRENLQILCGPCNHSKSAKHPISFAKEIGLLL